ncbi:uncharacterized protein LOC141703800 [Apium graveolens]|uniref:uncharacterized protein LOC141703800 n=1 Tax=Apium graveolens TaxID=4045 RepID=UPI003D7A2364
MTETENQNTNTNLQNAAINYNDPYFLSSGDNPRQQLGNLLLNGDNFINWSRGVKLALGAKNKLGFIDGTLSMPDSTSSDFNKWTRNDYMVMSWLTFSMEQVISDSFIFASTARDVWLDVSERFGKSNAPLLYELQTSLSKIEENNLSIAEYYGKLKNVWDKLQVLEGQFNCNCGALAKCTCDLLKKANEAAETKKLIQLICGLNKNYDNVKTNLLSMEPLPTVLKAYYILQQIEKQQSMTINMSKVPDVSAFYNNKPSFSVPRSFQNKNDFKRSKFDLTCDHCKKKGHTVDQCFKLTGVPEWYMNLKGKNSGVSTKFAANVADTSGLLGASPLDISFDSHLSLAAQSMDHQLVSHVYKEIMKMMQQNAGLSISEHDSSSVNFTGASDRMVFSLSLFDDLQILQEPIKMLYHMVLDLSTNTVNAVGTRSNDLYKFLSPEIQSCNLISQQYLNANVIPALDVFHARLGHASIGKMKHLSNLFSCNKFHDKFSCDSCILAKHHKLPFNDSPFIAPASFHLLHIDLWGPYQTPNLTGGRYFLTILDDFSRVTWTHLLTTKDQVFSIIQAFLVYIDNHNQTSVKFVRSDNGTEIVQQNCANLFASIGIVVNPVVSEFDSEMITPISSNLPPVIDNTSADSPTSTSSDIFIPHTTSDIISLSTSYKQAKEDPRWVEAMQKEIAALEANETWDLTPLPPGGHVIDINNAFLHGFIDEHIFMAPPPGYDVPPDFVCKLKRSIYGLRQASRQWNIELTKFLIDMGYSQSTQDYSLFVKQQDTSFTTIICYVDDLLLTGNDFDAIQSIKSDLHKAFTIKDLGDLKYFFGVEVSRAASGIRLNQRKYILDLLKDTNMLNCTPAVFPLSKRRLVGKLLYLNLTRPDIFYAVQQLSQFLSAPTQSHLNAAQHVLRYLKGTLNVGLIYKANISLELIAYCDVDWGTCPFSARSLSGYAIFLGSSLISWKIKKQKTVSKSTAEAEYRNMSYTTSELVWLEGLFIDL